MVKQTLSKQDPDTAATIGYIYIVLVISSVVNRSTRRYKSSGVRKRPFCITLEKYLYFVFLDKTCKWLNKFSIVPQ